MARRSAQTTPLAQLVRNADGVVRSIMSLVNKAFALVQDRVERSDGKLNFVRSARAREAVYDAIRGEMGECAEKVDALLKGQMERAAKAAAKTAGGMTGIEVKYSAERAEAILEVVTPAQGKSLAAVFTDRMGERMIRALREATVQTLREQAVAGGSAKEASKNLLSKWRKAAHEENPKFVDASGREWQTDAYIQMNVRTNSMRVYNDCLVDNVARSTGSDLMRISAGGDPGCVCAAWEGVIVSISGKTKAFPSYAEARNAGVFHPNCVHTLEFVSEVADADEIAVQRSIPVDHGKVTDFSAMNERKYKIDQKRYVGAGMSARDARVAVDRDNLDAALRNGLAVEGTRNVVDALTPQQVSALCKNGQPPKFEPFKPTKAELRKGASEKWNHGSRGGVVHIGREGLTAKKLVEVCGLDEQPKPKHHKPTPLKIKQPPASVVKDKVTRRMTDAGIDADTAKEVVDMLAPKVLENAQGVTFDVSSKCRLASNTGGAVELHNSPRDWNGHRIAIAHELGHAWWNKNGEMDASKTAAVRAAIDADFADIATRLHNLLGDTWELDCLNNNILFVKRKIAKEFLEIDFNPFTTELTEQKEVSRFLDMMMAATNGRLGRGHKPIYMKKERNAIHEIIAHCSSGYGNAKFAKLFPECTKLFAQWAAN